MKHRKLATPGLALLLLLAACGPSKKQRDQESYLLLQREGLPSTFTGASVIVSWRGFESHPGFDGDGRAQCAVIVYDLKGKSIDSFAAQLQADRQAGSANKDYTLRNWESMAELQARAHPVGIVPDSNLQHLSAPDYQPLAEPSGFCGMPESQRRPIAEAAKRAWTTPDSLLLVADLHYGGGAGPSGPRVNRYVLGVIDRQEQKLYTWLVVSNGGI